MKKNPVETILGFFVIIFAGVFLFLSASRIDTNEVKGYTISANFLKIGGLEVGSDVRISGIKVGSVLETKLNKENYTADVYLNIDSSIKLPIDTVAAIADVGIMGDKYVRLEPGKSQAILKDGDKMEQTKDFKTIEDLVGEVIFMVTGDE